MNTPEDLHEIWTLLEISMPASDEFRVKEVIVSEQKEEPVLLGIDAQKRWHILFPVSSEQNIVEDRRGRSVQIRRHNLVDKGALRLFVDFVCLKSHLNEMFSVVVSEVLEKLQKNDKPPGELCKQVLDRWRELLEQNSSGLPSMEVLVGLFGELWYLRELVRLNPSSIKFWLGPHGHRHDISTGEVAIEVKTTQISPGWIFEVHSIEQMEVPVNGKLYLAILKIEPEKVSGESLYDLVSSLIDLGVDKHLLFTKLSLIKISQSELDQSKSFRFRVTGNRIYAVGENFPCITINSFKAGALSQDIMQISYQVKLSDESFSSLDVAETNTLYHTIASEVN